ncbi:MAG: ATP:cob(I)alamin adenosyltransferase [Pseudomonadota bacterium]
MDTPQNPSATVTHLTLERRGLHTLDSGALCYLVGLTLDDQTLRNVMAWFVTNPPNNPGVRHAWAIQASQIADHPFTAWYTDWLDAEYHHEVALFGAVRRPEQLARLWAQLHDEGRSPGAWWALLTHPRVTDELIQRAGSDLHMLGHNTAREVSAHKEHIAACENRIAELQAELSRVKREAQSLATLHARETTRWVERLAAAQRHIVDLRTSVASGPDGPTATTVVDPQTASDVRACVLCVRDDESSGPCVFRGPSDHPSWRLCQAHDAQLLDHIAEADVVVCDTESTMRSEQAFDFCRQRGTPVLFLNQPFSDATVPLVERLTQSFEAN